MFMPQVTPRAPMPLIQSPLPPMAMSISMNGAPSGCFICLKTAALPGWPLNSSTPEPTPDPLPLVKPVRNASVVATAEMPMTMLDGIIPGLENMLAHPMGSGAGGGTGVWGAGVGAGVGCHGAGVGSGFLTTADEGSVVMRHWSVPYPIRMYPLSPQLRPQLFLTIQ